MKSIKQFLLISLKKLTILTLVFSIGFIQSIEFKIDVQATSITSNPFESLDLSRENRIERIQADQNTISTSAYRTNSISKLDNSQYFVKFKETVSFDVIARVLTPYVYNMLGSSKNRTFAISTEDYLGLETALSGLVDYIEYEGDLKIRKDTSDTYYSLQWGLKATNIEPLWTYSTGQPNVYVCIIDTGLTRNHPDLKSSRFLAGIDYNNYGDVLSDTDGHGTFVAGIIGADTHNSTIGIAGIAYNSFIVPFRIPQDTDGYFDSSKIIEAVYDAADIGCDVINMSLGGPTSNSTFNSAIQYAINKGSIIVAAAGNEAQEGNPISYPASYDNVISVGSVDKLLSHSYFSNYNNYIDVVAPGESILSTNINGSYTYGSGTSYSAPFVSGIAALIKAIKPDLLPNEFNNILSTSSTDLGVLGYDVYYGNGLINAEKILERLFKPASVSNFKATYSGANKTVQLSWDPLPNVDSYSIYNRIGNTDSYTKIGSTTDTMYLDSSVLRNSVETYKLVAVKMINNHSYEGYDSNTITITIPPQTATLHVEESDQHNYTLFWDAIPTIQEYLIFQNNIQIASVSNLVTSYELKNLKSGEKYEYYVVSKSGTNLSENSNIVTIKPILNSPINFSIINKEFDGFTFKWSPIDLYNNYTYEIVYSTTLDGIYKSLNLTNQNNLTSKVSGLNFNTTYYFKIRAIDQNNNISYLSNPISGKTEIAKPSNFSVASPTASSADLSWSAVEGAAGYEISYSKGSSTTYTILRSVTTLNTNHTGLSVNTVFNYRVRAYRMAGTTKVYSGYSDVKSIATPPSAPVIKAVSKSIDTITLTWTKVVNATGYVVYVNGVENSVINDGNTISTDISGLNLGESYDFSLVAKNGELSSTPSAIVKATPIPGSVSNFKVSDMNFNRLSLSWDSVEGADHYDVYQGTSSTAVNTKVGSVSETSFSTTTPLNFNTVYYYKVIPVTVNGISGVVSTIINGKTAIKSPVDFSVASPTASSADLSWSAVEGAAGYEISYSKGSSTTYTILRSVTTLNTNHTGLSVNTVFNYRVRAYRMAGTTKVYSGYSDVKSIATPPSAPVIKLTSINGNTLQLSWAKVLNAKNYEIYMDNQLLQVVDSNKLSIEITGLNPDVIYTFFIVSVNDDLKSSPSLNVKGSPSLLSVSDLKVADININRILLTWSSVIGAEKYDIYQGTTSTTITNKIASTTDTSILVNSLNFNTQYYFKIVPVSRDGKVGIASLNVSAKTKIKSPDNFKINETSERFVDLVWDMVEGADGYEIYYSLGNSTSFTLLTSLSNLTYKHNGLNPDSIINYKIRSFKLIGLTKIYSDYVELNTRSSLDSIYLKYIANDSNSYKLMWNSISGASEYIINRTTMDNSFTEEYARTNDLQIEILNDIYGTNYKYNIYAISETNSSAKSNTVIGGPLPENIKGVQLTSNHNSISLSWEGSVYAENYDIYISSIQDYIGRKIGSTQDCFYTTNIDLIYNSTYFFTIVPVSKVGITLGSKSMPQNHSSKTSIENVKELTFTQSGNSISLDWNDVIGYTGYDIYYSKNGGTFYYHSTAYSSQKNITDLLYNTNYSFKVQSFKTVNYVKYKTEFSNSISLLTPLQSPDLTIAHNKPEEFLLTWNAISQATGYEVYQNNQLLTILNSNTTPQLLITDIVAGNTYTYSVVAINNGNRSEISKTVTKTAEPKAINDLKIADINYDRLTLSWSAVPGAAKYKIYYGYEYKEPEFLIQTYPTETTFTITPNILKLNYGSKYIFKVVAVTENNFGSFNSNIVKGELNFKKVDNIVFNPIDKNNLNLSWDPVEGANKYTIITRDLSNAAVKFYTSYGLSYENIQIIPNVDYKIAIVPEYFESINRFYVAFDYEYHNYRYFTTESISLNQNSISLNLNESYALTSEVGPSSATIKTVEYSSDNLGVAIVDENGLVTGVGIGSTTITAKTKDGLTAICEVSVGLEINGSNSQTIVIGGLLTGQYKITANYFGDSSFVVNRKYYNPDDHNLFNETGSYSGSNILFYDFTWYDIIFPFEIDVITEGNWNLKIEKLDNISTSNISGSGDRVTDKILRTSIYKTNDLININHVGEGRFIITAYNYGQCVEIVNTVGNYSSIYDSSFLIYGDVFFVIESSGDWSIDFNRGDSLTIY